mmetsp:Transcript_83343/g.212200  ORF Transcript_83343/g.212200 Transcript_83343/m.212200 type:complete len:90 (-) Transcript_83343:13-282(-)
MLGPNAEPQGFEPLLSKWFQGYRHEGRWSCFEQFILYAVSARGSHLPASTPPLKPGGRLPAPMALNAAAPAEAIAIGGPLHGCASFLNR